MIQSNKAIDAFKSDFNCAQSVLIGYADSLNFDKNLAINMSCGFGAGMGRLQKTCGAVTGAFMVFGIYNSLKYTENSIASKISRDTIQEFQKRFLLMHGTTDCKTLLNCNLRTEEGQQYFNENKLIEKICEKLVSDSVKIIYELIFVKPQSHID